MESNIKQACEFVYSLFEPFLTNQDDKAEAVVVNINHIEEETNNQKKAAQRNIRADD
jgi:hypothetical protein